MQIEQTGKVVAVLPEQRFNGKNGEIVKNAFVIEWQDNGYKQKLCLEVVGSDKWDKMKSSAVVGNTVLVRFGISSREYNGKYYTTASCWYCASVGGNQQVQTSQQQSAHPQSDDAVPF